MDKKNSTSKFFSIFLFLYLFSSTVFAELNAQWSLDENSGTIANDQSDNALHLNLNNMSETNWVSGQFNSALDFNGSNQDASISSDTSALQTESVTLSAWVYPVRTSVNYESIATQSDNYGLILRSRLGTEAVVFYVKNAGSGWTQVTSPFNILEFDQWQHIAGTFDASTNTSKLYVNGVEVSSVDVGQSIGYTRGDGFTIGSKNGSTRFFKGRIDEVRVYDSALTNAEIFQLSAFDDVTPPVITLNGANPVSVAPGTIYTDAGATAIDDVDGSVTVTDDAVTVVDTSVEGNSYVVTFTATDSAGNTSQATRVVNIATPVPDTIPPVITLNGANPVSVTLGTVYTDAGATAMDDVDESISVSIDATEVDTSTEGSYTVYFTATDSASNTANATRIVEVIASTGPIITLIGEDSINVPLNDIYTDPGATAFDNEDGISVDVDIDISDVDIFVMGSYSVTFTATDSENNTSTAIRTVIVVDPVPGTVKILPLGDSITDSINGRPSYRRSLWHQLKAAGYAVDFVGRPGYRHSTVPESLLDYDIDHEGHAGVETQNIRSQITGWMDEFTADIVLLHTGTNDLDRGPGRGEVPIDTVNRTLQEIDGIIQRIRAKNSSVIILLAKIIPMKDYDTAIFNDEVDNFVSTRTTDDSPIIVVDHYTGFDPEVDNYDNYHPNEGGEIKMANKWFQALEPFLTSTTTPLTHLLPHNQWHQISLPMNPGSNNTVADIFGDDGLGAYGTDWVLYSYNPDTNDYEQPGGTDTLSQGVGYWIIQMSGDDKLLKMPTGSTETPTTTPTGCPENKSCFEIPLGTEVGTEQWNMVGYPFAVSGLLSNSRIVASTIDCTSGCEIEDAEIDGIFQNQLWSYNGTGYVEVTTTIGTLDPWLGYWAATLNNANTNNPSLLFSK